MGMFDTFWSEHHKLVCPVHGEIPFGAPQTKEFECEMHLYKIVEDGTVELYDFAERTEDRELLGIWTPPALDGYGYATVYSSCPHCGPAGRNHAPLYHWKLRFKNGRYVGVVEISWQNEEGYWKHKYLDEDDYDEF